MKLLLIDDETTTRQGIQKYTNWKKLGIDQVISFSDPLAALDYVKEESVDIILSDIRMPNLDGIQLCKAILNINPHICIIFISGYSDKEFLLNAIQMSAVDYIEKPINIPKLEAAIKRAINKLQHENYITRQHENAIDIIQKNKQLQIDHLVQKLINESTCNESALKEQLLSIDETIEFPLNNYDYYQIYLFKSRPDTIGLKDKMNTISNRLAESALIPDFVITRKEDNTYLLLARFHSQLNYPKLDINRYLSHMLVTEHMAQSVSCSHSKLLHGFHNIPKSYNQAVIAWQKNFFYGYGSILSYEDQTSAAEEVVYHFPEVSAFKDNLLQHNQANCEKYLTDLLHFCQTHTEILPDTIRNEYFKILTIITQTAMAQAKLMQLTESGTEYLWKRISILDTLVECHQCALEEISHFFNDLDQLGSDNKAIMDVIRFIHAHYKEHEFHINQIANYVYLTPNYLSSLFKRVTGRTIGNYITEIRLEQSCKLLTQPGKKLNEVAFEVGYTDPKYYSKLFKKYYHMTPSEYQNRLTER